MTSITKSDRGAWRVRLACGHQGAVAVEVAPGDFVSCWAVAEPGPGCQTQRRVVEVWQACLF